MSKLRHLSTLKVTRFRIRGDHIRKYETVPQVTIDNLLS